MKSKTMRGVVLLGFTMLLATWGVNASETRSLSEAKRMKSCNSIVMKECRSLKGEAFGACQAEIQKGNDSICSALPQAKQKTGAVQGLKKPRISKEAIRGSMPNKTKG
jgi:hypothetical protein